MNKDWYNEYQKSNKEEFNKEFIYGRNTNEDLQDILSDVCKSLEIVNGVTFKGVEIEKDESKFIQSRYIDLSDSRLIQAKLKFHIKSFSAINPSEIEEEDITIPIFFPKIVENFYYQIGGAKYYSILQILDKGIYTTNKSLALKTLLMPINFKNSAVDLKTSDGTGYTGEIIKVDLFKKQINILTYYTAKFGVKETLKYFGFDFVSMFVAGSEYENFKNDPSVKFFELGAKGKNRLGVRMSNFEKDTWKSTFLCCFINYLSTNKITYEDVIEDSISKWKKNLGKCFTATNVHLMEDKATSILCSLERILDNRTKKNLVHIADHDKSDTYSIMRWMMVFFKELSSEENMDLKNKRLRLAEYLVYPLIRKFSDSTYRMLTLVKRINIGSLKTIFSNISPDFCIKKLITSKMLRYSSSVNSFDMFIALKVSQTGPQGLANAPGSELPVKYRGHHESYIGNIGLNACSAGDPGLTMTLTPFVKLDGFFFSTTREYETNFVGPIQPENS